MFNFKTFLQHAALALALAIGSGAAVAGPTYQVTIDTTAFDGDSGLLDFSFANVSGAVPAQATLFGFSGAFGAEFDRSGSVAGDLASGLFFTNSGDLSYLTQVVQLGASFVFNIRFDGDFETIEGADGSAFTVGLYSSDMQDTFGIPVVFDLLPGFLGAPSEVLVTLDPALATVDIVAVPEPSQLLLVLTGLALLGAGMRRRAASVRH